MILDTIDPLAAHPRSRGEHWDMSPSQLRTSGSSPLARGTCNGDFNALYRWRLIPARAGNIRPGRAPHPSASAHPRSRGEHARTSTTGASDCGSSPLARGTCDQRIGKAAGSRLIPARAGNILVVTGPSWSTAAHPRSRGEHKSAPRPIRLFVGSSPLARGTCSGFRGGRGDTRLIPARAGNMPRLGCGRRVG